MDRDRFDALVDRSAEHHIWTGAVNPQRRTGRLKVAGRQVTAHRHAWELAHGPLPASAKVLACPGEPACVRIDHLRVEGLPESLRPATRARKGTGSIRQVRPGVWKLAATAPAGAGGGSKRVHRVVHARTTREATEELGQFCRRGPFGWSPERRGCLAALRRSHRALPHRAPAGREGPGGEDHHRLPGGAPQVVRSAHR